MAESTISMAEGTPGKKAHTWNKTVGGNSVEDEFVLPGEFPLAGYVVAPSGASADTTANSHVLQIMAGSATKVRIRRIRIYEAVVHTTLAYFQYEIWRLTTAGTGGTAVTPRPLDTADAAAGATAMTLPTVKGTEGVQLDSMVLPMEAAVTAGAPALKWEWTQHPGMPPIIIPAGTANGIAIKNVTAQAAGAVRCIVEFVETAY